jgi:glycosyltransferase involved in cell wall biosynthesis
MRSEGGLVFLNTVKGGGAYQYLKRTSQRVPVLAIDILGTGPVSVEWMWRGERIDYTAPSMEAAIESSGCTDVHVNHLVFARPLLDWVERLRRLSGRYRLHLVVHDYFAVCPSVNLLDHRGRYCGIPGAATCDTCLAKLADAAEATEFSRFFAGKYPEVRDTGIGPWRRTWSDILALMETVIFPSASARDLLRKAFPALGEERCRVVPHEMPVPDWLPNRKDVGVDGLLEVCLIGEISDHKGARILDELLTRVKAESKPVRFRVVGKFIYAGRHSNNPHLQETGLFHPADLQGLLAKQRIDIFLFPSIWPETFSYVVHEMMGTGLPILATRIGAHGEALEGYDGAWLVDDFNASVILERLMAFYRQRQALQASSGELPLRAMEFFAAQQMRLEWSMHRLEALQQRISTPRD